MTPSDGTPPFAGRVPLQEISLPLIGGALGIPEVVLAAYRNAELALESSTPGCGLSWSLLAGIGRIESGHAGGGRTDAAGTTVSPIYGPALDGTLPGNEVIKAASGGYVRAVGPMQFLPSTWDHYAADGNGDGVADPNNVFDAALAAGKYLCSGGLNLRDQAQELQAVLRYNNSTAYAANVLSWAAAYRTGGAPTQVTISPDLIPPGSAAPAQIPDMTAVTYTNSTPTTTAPAAPQTTTATPTPTEVMITIPGLPPIPCGIFCPPPPKPLNPCEPAVIPAPMPQPGELAEPAVVPGAPAQTFGAGVAPKDPAVTDAKDPAHPDQPPVAPVCTPPDAAQQQAQPPQPPAPGQQAVQTPEATPEAPPTVSVEPAPSAEAAPTQQPGITLPFGIVIPLPPAPQG